MTQQERIMDQRTREATAADFDLSQDLHRVVADADALLAHAVQGAGQEYTKARHRLEQSLLAVKARLASAQDAAFERGREAARSTDELVRRHPWESIGIAGALGLAIGLLLGRR
jgi:ElaB/YqjD/DUF883 family membrane-anchored ribosome-binding protein